MKRPVLVLLALALYACATTGGNQARQNQSLSDKGQEKPGAKIAVVTPPPATGQETALPSPTLGKHIEEPPVPTEAAQLAFVKKHGSPSSTFTEQDRQFVRELPASPVAGSVTEAALALGLIKITLNPAAGDLPTFQEADLAKAPAAAPAPGAAPGAAAPAPAVAEVAKNKTPSLEQLCKDHNLNLPDALVENPLLGSYGIAKQVHMALPVGANSAEFKNEILVAVKRQASLWQEFSTSLNAPGEETLPVAAAATTPKAEDLPPSAADLAGGDAALGDAQTLADRGNYQAAIRKASAVPTTSPMHPMAQEKIKEFSNLAVQELRKKAASAFQSAMPVTEAKTRAGYLKQAKTFLEEAIKNYPDATQLPTVRDNLRVISRDLEKLETEQGG